MEQLQRYMYELKTKLVENLGTLCISPNITVNALKG